MPEVTVARLGSGRLCTCASRCYLTCTSKPEDLSPQPAPWGEFIGTGGDIDTTWSSLSLFANWPVPVVFVPGNHEFDGRDVDEALLGLRDQCRHLGIRLLEGLLDCHRTGRAPHSFVGTTLV